MIYARIARIPSDPLRGILATFWFPIELLGWLWAVLWNDPKQLITERPYAIARSMYLIAVDGILVGTDVENI